jgi:hypothetical protein
MSNVDTAGHIGPGFGANFATWGALRNYLADWASQPGYDLDRAIHQLLMTDLAARLCAQPGFDWVLRGSLALPTRPDREQGQVGGVDPVYSGARPAFDVDLCAQQLPTDASPGALLSVALQVMNRTGDVRLGTGIGLGGLVDYQTNDLRQLGDGRVVGQVTAQPIDPVRSSAAHRIPVDDQATINVDLSPPGAAVFAGRPEVAKRPTMAIPVPGFQPFVPDLHPTASQIADKITAIVAPHTNPPWHRYKDVFDLVYLVSGCTVPVDPLRAAIAGHKNLTRAGLADLPDPFRLYGYARGGGEVDWQYKYEKMRRDMPALADYPPFEVSLAEVTAFVVAMRHAPAGYSWSPESRSFRPPAPPDRRPNAFPHPTAQPTPLEADRQPTAAPRQRGQSR